MASLKGVLGSRKLLGISFNKSKSSKHGDHVANITRQVTKDVPVRPPLSLLKELADASCNTDSYASIMDVVAYRLDKGVKKPSSWNKVYNSLVVVEHLIIYGAGHIREDLRKKYLTMLEVFSKDFRCVDKRDGTDHGYSVRVKAAAVLNLLLSESLADEERMKMAHQGSYSSEASSNATSRSSSNPEAFSSGEIGGNSFLHSLQTLTILSPSEASKDSDFRSPIPALPPPPSDTRRHRRSVSYPDSSKIDNRRFGGLSSEELHQFAPAEDEDAVSQPIKAFPLPLQRQRSRRSKSLDFDWPNEQGPEQAFSTVPGVVNGVVDLSAASDTATNTSALPAAASSGKDLGTRPAFATRIGQYSYGPQAVPARLVPWAVAPGTEQLPFRPVASLQPALSPLVAVSTLPAIDNLGTPNNNPFVV
ncbi:unnamed protein product [Closterium sp. Yama58-4]|nr:unnamed protein product [Closterium sp. Yama58-4]